MAQEELLLAVHAVLLAMILRRIHRFANLVVWGCTGRLALFVRPGHMVSHPGAMM